MPNRLNPRIVKKMATPGKFTNHGAVQIKQVTVELVPGQQLRA